jgi:hypothetical protein|tara:strand:+ start:762 stop:1448 length:687 start_codon:yes stop_codon:yes gene_type:complete
MGTRIGSPTIVTDGIVFYVDAGDKISYPGSGTTWSDLGRHKTNATLVGSPTFDSGNGGCFDMDGSDDVANASDANLPLGSSARTICAWITNTRKDAWVSICHYGTSSNNSSNFFSIGDTSDGYKLHMAAFNNTADGSTAAVPNDEWCHVAMSYGSNAVNYYINGSASGGDASYTGVNTTSDGTLAIGENKYASVHRDGKISSFIIYDRALTASEILKNYNAQKYRFGL